MILEHYNLKEQPFGVTPNPRYYFASSAHREALASLVCGIECQVGFAALISAPGLGKTTLLFSLLERYNSETQTAFLFNTQCDTRDLLRDLARELHIETADSDHETFFSEFSEFLAEHTSKPVLLVIDEAQNLDDSLLETVRLLSNFETAERKLLHIILSGQMELSEKLQGPHLSQLAQRIMVVSRLRGLTFQETNEYIEHRLRVAGYRGPKLFSAEAFAEIYRASKGVPRSINRLCFNALLLGAAENKHCLDAQIIEEVVRDIDLGSTCQTTDGIGDTQFGDVTSAIRVARRTNLTPASSGAAARDSFRLRDITRGTGEKSEAGQYRTSEKPPAVRGSGTGITATNSKSAQPGMAHAKPADSGKAFPNGDASLRSSFGATQSPAQRMRRRIRSLGSGHEYLNRTLIGAAVMLAIGASLFAYLRVHTQSLPVESAHASLPAAAKAEDSQQLSPANTYALGTERAQPRAVTGSKGSHINVTELHSRSSKSATESESLEALPVPDSMSHPIDLGAASPPPKEVAKAGDDDVSPPSIVAQPPTFNSALNIVANSAAAKSPPPVLVAPPPHLTPERQSAASLEPLQIVEPVYPPLARSARIQGGVVLRASIDSSGAVSEVKVVKGASLLAEAAVEAVKRWRYSPTPHTTTAETRYAMISINFSLP